MLLTLLLTGSRVLLSFIRSLHMHLYVMHKREVLVTLAAFVCSFILLLFIGLAGPNVTKLDAAKASDIFRTDGINETTASQLLQRGPFSIFTPAMSTYSQHLSLYVTFFLKNEEAAETFNTEFVIALRIEGITDTSHSDKVRTEILNEDISMDGGRVHHLFCSVRKCNPIQVFHLEFLEYQHYNFEVTFRKLESVHKKYGIEDIRFSFQSINSSFTTLTIWFKFVFLVSAFTVTVSRSLCEPVYELRRDLLANVVLVHPRSASIPIHRMVHGAEVDGHPTTTSRPVQQSLLLHYVLVRLFYSPTDGHRLQDDLLLSPHAILVSLLPRHSTD